MSDFTFTHLSLREAEDQLAGACVRHPYAVEFCIDTLPDDAFRNSRENRAIVYLLLHWWEDGTYDRETNEDRLSEVLSRIDPLKRDDWWWRDYLDALWTPWVAVPLYAHGLTEAVAEAYRLKDAALSSTKRWLHSNPLQAEEWIKEAFTPASPPSASNRAARLRPERGTLDAFNK